MKFRLYLDSPTVIFRARVNQASFTYPLAEVTFDSVTVGAYGDITTGMTVVFGSSLGASDLGRQYIRKPATADTIYIGRSSQGTHDGEVDLDDDVYIEVWNDYRVWPKVPTMPVVDGQDLTTYKEHDIAVGLYTTNPPPVANAGAGFAGTIDPISEVVTVNFDATNSFAMADGATITGYQWFMYDGTIVSGTDTDAAITATFPAGFRWIALTVTDSNGLTHTARAPIYARDPASDTSTEHFQITRHRKSFQGQEVTLKVMEDIPFSTYPDGTLALIWDDDVSTNSDREGMVFIGWHHTDPVEISGEKFFLRRDTSLELLDVAGRLKVLPGFPQVLLSEEIRDTDAHSDITWEHMVNPTMHKYAHYILQWHSTALVLADFRFRGDVPDMPFLKLESDGRTLFDQVANRLKQMTPDHIFTCNRLGQLAVWPDPMLQDVADRTTASQAGEILPDEWVELRYTHQHAPTVYWMRGGAIVSQDTPTYNADGSLNIPTVFCIAPGNAPGFGTQEVEDYQRLTLSQEDLNKTIGHKYARENAPQSHFTITLAGSDDLGLEPANLEWVWLGLSADEAAQRGLFFLTMAGGIPVYQEQGLVHSVDITYKYAPEGMTRNINVEWERATVGKPAITYVPPTVEPADDYEPTPYIPPEPLPEYGEFNSGLRASGGTVAVISTGDEGIWVTDNFLSDVPIWRVTGRVAPIRHDHWVVDPFSPGYRGVQDGPINGYVLTGIGHSVVDHVYKVTDIFGTPSAELLFEVPGIPSDGSATGTIACSFGRFFSEETDNPWLMVAVYCLAGGLDGGLFCWYSKDAGKTWSDKKTITTHRGGPFSREYQPAVHMSSKQFGRAWVIGPINDVIDGWESYWGLYRTDDWGETWSLDTSLGVDPVHYSGGTLHFPWLNNDDEKIAYYTRQMNRDSSDLLLELHKTDGAGNSNNVSPNDGSVNYGADYIENSTPTFRLRTYDSNEEYVALAGRSSGPPTVRKIWLSDDGGSTWADRTGADDDIKNIAFSGDNPNVLYRWSGSTTGFYYTTDFGVTWESKRGNLPSSVMQGIAGGPITATPITLNSGWWSVDGIALDTVVAAYDFYSATDLSDAYKNRLRTGVFDLLPGVAPSFSAGLVFTGTEYLLTGIHPFPNYAMIVAYEDATFGQVSFIAGRSGGTGLRWGIYTSNNTSLTPSYQYYQGGSRIGSNSLASAVVAVTNDFGYLNGVQDHVTPITSWTSPGLTPYEVFIGGSNTSGSFSSPFKGKITHLAIYAVSPTPTQIASVTTAIQAELSA